MKNSSSRMKKISSSSSNLPLLLLLLLLLLLIRSSRAALPSTQTQALLAIQKLLESPSALGSWSNGDSTSFCTSSSAKLNISCSSSSSSGGDTLVLLQIAGDKKSIPVEQKLAANYNESQVRLSDDFSISSLANALLKFPDLRDLSLVSLGLWGPVPASLDRLRSLQRIDLSDNLFAGAIPDRFAALGSLQSINLSNNMLTGAFPSALNVLPNLDTLDLSSNRLTGTIPTQVSLFTNLKSLQLSKNQFFGPVPRYITNLRSLTTLLLFDNLLAGEVPDLSSMDSLQVMDLSGNQLGPSVPGFIFSSPSLLSINLSKNRLTSNIPANVSTSQPLQSLNLSINTLVGTPPVELFTSMFNLQSLALDHNRLSGTLASDLQLSAKLVTLDISSNFFTGELPQGFNSSRTNIRCEENCFSNQGKQQPQDYCLKALQMGGIFPPATASGNDGSGKGGSSGGKGKKKRWKGGVVAGIAGGTMALGAAATVLLLILLKLSKNGKLKAAASTMHCAPSSCADTGSVGVPAEFMQNTRYLAHSGGVSAAGPPQCRIFAIWELEEATGRFSQSGIIGEGDYGKVFKGKLDDGTTVAVKCIAIDAKQDVKQLKSHLEFLSRIRHRNLVPLFGYCLEREKDGQQSRRLFLVSEFIENGTLRSHLLYKRRVKESLTWSSRLVAVLGAARGLQFLHTGVVPGIFNNDVRITNILLDANFVAKLVDFGLARHDESSASAESYGSEADLFTEKSVTYIDLDHHHRKLATDKKDVYNFGLVLLEVVLGRPPTIDNPHAAKPKIQELEMMLTDSVFRSEMVDSAIAGTCAEDSLSTVLEIAAKCLSHDPAARPSMEDVLWNLQYAVQVQERRHSGELPEEQNGHAE